MLTKSIRRNRAMRDKSTKFIRRNRGMRDTSTQKKQETNVLSSQQEKRMNDTGLSQRRKRIMLEGMKKYDRALEALSK